MLFAVIDWPEAAVMGDLHFQKHVGTILASRRISQRRFEWLYFKHRGQVWVARNDMFDHLPQSAIDLDTGVAPRANVIGSFCVGP
jgi:hypothetical protein